MSKRSVQPSPSNAFDVVICGAGVVGATAACALSRLPLRIAVIDRALPGDGWHAAHIDLRVSAMSLASRQIFSNLGAWNGMVSRRVSPFAHMHVWESARGSIHFDSADIGESAMGYIIENRVICQALTDVLGERENVTLLVPSALTQLRVDDSSVHIGLDDGREIQATLLIGADGAASRVRALSGIETVGWAYDQHAVVTNVTTAHSHAQTAWQRFLPDGPLAFLPLSNGQCSIVWSTEPEHAQMLLGLSEQAFCEALEVAIQSRLGRILDVGERARFPLRLQHALNYVAPRVALIGDAAHAIHPLAGQGANLGFLDAAALAQTLADAQRRGMDIGAFKTLRRYERWRKGENLAMMSLMDGFKRAFGSADRVLRTAREVGLASADRIAPVKHFFMRHAMGLEGDLPELAQVRLN